MRALDLLAGERKRLKELMDVIGERSDVFVMKDRKSRLDLGWFNIIILIVVLAALCATAVSFFFKQQDATSSK